MQNPPNSQESPWELVSLALCGELYCGQSPSTSEVNTDGRGEPYFTGPEQWDGTKLRVEKWTEFPKRLVPEGCIFITVKGAGVGKLFPGKAGAIGRDIYAFHVHPELEFKYFYYCLRHTIDSVVLQAKGDIPGLSRTHILEHQVLLPSASQQRRIVAKIEELFSELDKGVGALTTARQQLIAYRQSVLIHAFEGKLTEEWRRTNRVTVQSLLGDIQCERETHKKKKLARREVEQRDLSLTPQVPAGWTTDYLGNLNVAVFDGPFGSHLKTSDYAESGIRVIRLENIGQGNFIDEKRSFVSEQKYKQIQKHTVVPGDIVFSSFVTEAIRSTLVPSHIPFAVNKADCFGVRFFGNTVKPKFVQFFFQSRNVFKQIEGMIHGVGRPRINTSQLKEVIVPVCSPLEQSLVIDRLEGIFSETDTLADEIEKGLLRLAILRQAILQKAFSGQLVAQVVKDEPPCALLERIRARRESTTKSTAFKNQRVARNGRRGKMNAA